jgi:hypothetical protein
MPRFRLKARRGGAWATLPLATPDGAATKRDLVAAAAALVRCAGPLRLSLNGRAELGGGAETPLAELGVAPGDTLWLLNEAVEIVGAPAPAPPPPPPERAGPSPPAEPERPPPPPPPPPPRGLAVPAALLRELAAHPAAAATDAGAVSLVAHAALAEAGLRAAPGADPASGRVEYALPGAGAAAACALAASALGGELLLAAAAPGGAPRHLILRPADYFEPPPPAADDCAGGGGADAPAGAPADAPLPPHLRLAGRAGVVLHGRALLGGARLRDLYNRLKDELAAPMLAEARRAAGLAPPTSLLALPAAARDKVLAALPAADLAAASAACAELRREASADELWLPLLAADFSPAWGERRVGFARAGELAAARGAKFAYARLAVDRREREAEARRAARWLVPPGRRFAPPPPPHYPVPAPPGFPGVIGGDQDRLPFLGGGAGGRGALGGIFPGAQRWGGGAGFHLG